MQTAAEANIVATVTVLFDSAGVVAGTKESAAALKGLAVEADSLNASTTESVVASQSFRSASVASAAGTKALSTETALAKVSAADMALGYQAATGSVSQFGVANLVTKGNVALLTTAVGVEALKSFADYQQGLADLRGNTGETAQQIGAASSEIMTLGRDGSIGLDDLTTAIRHASDEGYRFAAGAQVVDAGWKGSIITDGKAADVVNTLATAMADFHQPASLATKDMSEIIVGSQRGNETLEQMVTGMSRLNEVTGALHMPMSDVIALQSTLTKATGDANIAQTQAVNLIVHIINPTKQAIGLMQELHQATGVDLVNDFQRFSQGQMSFKSVMEAVKTATGGNVQELEALFGGLRGGTGAVALLDSQWQSYLDTQQRMRSSTTQTNAEFQTQQGTFSNRVKQGSNILQEGLITVGSWASSYINDVVKVDGYLEGLYAKEYALTDSILGVSDATKASTPALNDQIAALKAHLSVVEDDRMQAQGLAELYGMFPSLQEKINSDLAEETKLRQQLAATIDKQTRSLNDQNQASIFQSKQSFFQQTPTVAVPQLASYYNSQNAGVQSGYNDALQKYIFDATHGFTESLKADQATLDQHRAAYEKILAIQDKESQTLSDFNQSLKTSSDTYDVTSKALTAAQTAARDEWLKTGQILPSTRAEVVDLTGKLAGADKALSAITASTDPLGAAQQKLQLATTAAYQDLAKDGSILPAHRQALIVDTKNLDAMTKAVSDVTSSLKQDSYQSQLAAAQKKEQAAADALALHDTAANRAAYDAARAKVTALTNAYDLHTGATDRWTIGMTAAQDAVNKARDTYLEDRKVYGESAAQTVAAKQKLKDATDTLHRFQVAVNGVTQDLLAKGSPEHGGETNAEFGHGVRRHPPESGSELIPTAINNTTLPFNFGPNPGGGTTLGGFHLGIPNRGQIDTLNQSQTQADYSAKEQAEQAIIDSLKHKAVLESQDLSLTDDQRKVDLDIFQIKQDRRQTQLDLAKLEALQASGTATPDQIAAARQTVTNDRNKTGEDTGQLANDKSQQTLDAIQTGLTNFSTQQQNLNTIAQDQLTVSQDQGALGVQKLNAVVTSITDQTAVISAQSALDTAKSSAATTAITDQTAIMAATYKLGADSITSQRTIDEDLRNGDTAKMALDQKLAADTMALDRDGISIAKAEAARDAATSAEQIQIAEDGVTIAKDKASADAAADSWQATTLKDQLDLDKAKLQLAKDQIQLTSDSNTILNAINSKAGSGKDFSSQLTNDTMNVSLDEQSVNSLAQKLGDDQTAANVSAAGWAKLEANDAQTQASDQALLAATQGNWGKALAILQQSQETDSENLSTDQGALDQLTAMRQDVQQSLQLKDISLQGQTADLEYQKTMISLNQGMSDSQKASAQAEIQVQEDGLAVQEANLKLQEVRDGGGSPMDVLQAILAVTQAGYTLNEDQLRATQATTAAVQDGNAVATLQAMLKVYQGLLRQQNLPISTGQRGGSTLRYGYGLTAASAGANRGKR